MRREVDRFFMALMFFTRVPIPRWARYDAEDFHHACRYFPWVGALVGGVGAGIYVGARYLIGEDAAIVLSMGATVLITGAFHEDGWADLCDGFGGAYDAERTLTIMKDSRVGAFGVIGVVLLLLLKFCALRALAPSEVPWVLVTGHVVSRGVSGLYLLTLPYVQADARSKSKPLARRMSPTDACVSTVLPFGVCVAWGWRVLPAAAGCLVVFLVFGELLRRRLGGYTGDCLGAAQQLQEVTVYLLWGSSLWSSI